MAAVVEKNQAFGIIRPVAIGLGESTRAGSVAALNQILADTIALRDLYKKHHWQVSGPTFHQLHLLFDKHHSEQVTLVDDLAERISALGGVPVATSHDVAAMTSIPRAPQGRESPPDQLQRLVEAHEIILIAARQAARAAAASGDDGTNDLLVSGVIRTHETQAWMVAEHLEGAARR